MRNITLSTATPTADSGTDPNVTITVSPAPAAGTTIRFSLTVVDSNGIASQPAIVAVEVVPLPVAVPKGPTAVSVGASIVLDASASTPKGQISIFKWQLMAASVAGGPTTGANPNVSVTTGTTNPNA